MSVRTLSAYEEKRLEEMNLTPKQADAARKVWAEEKEITKKWWLPLFHLLTPALIAIFTVNMIAPSSLTAGLDNLATFVTWFMCVIVIPLYFLMCIITGSKEIEKAPHPLSYTGLSITKRSKGIGHIFGVIMSITLLVVLAMSGHTFTALTFVIAYGVAHIGKAGLKKKVEDALENAENGRTPFVYPLSVGDLSEQEEG